MADARSEGAPSTSASSPTASGSTVDTGPDDMFIRHKLNKMETLAGLAVKYNVSVADIKRANNFQSDTAMFAKDTLLIPTKPLPIGPEYAAWAGIIVAHYGKIPTGHMRASSTAALSELRGYYSTSHSLYGSPDASDDDAGEGGGLGGPRGRRRLPQGEVELMSRQQSSQATPGGGHIEERLRRRRNIDDESDFEDLPLELLTGTASGGPSPLRPPLFRSSTERRERSESLGSGLQDLTEWHRKSLKWKDLLLTKLKKVASQPALVSRSSASSMAQAADAAVASTRPGGPGGVSVTQQMQAAAYSLSNQRSKDCPKVD